ncbi:MAG: exonuclease domain-containing protein [Lachnospiraceae bacterium]|nr:exonuclease domain-containing protein [Lachnospiraceae bacterium]
MNYIMLDLEWNQAAYKIDEEAEIPFEIIEIGAVKLDKNLVSVDEFQALIRPQVYPFLVRRTRQITGWTDKDLDTKGIYFEDACEAFLKWCGKDYIFCIWGTADLIQLERNMAYYDIPIPWKYPFKYLDVQKLFALQAGEGKTRRALESVIDHFRIPMERPFHHAVDDAAYTAEVFRHIDRRHFESYYSVDYYKVPKNIFEEATFYFDTYSKYVSRSFPLKEEAVGNRRVREMYCFYCRKRLKRIVNWFSDAGRSYLALGECRAHGLMRGRIRIKQTENYDGFFAVRTIKPCTEEAMDMILGKKENVKNKRRERRHRDKDMEEEPDES